MIKIHVYIGIFILFFNSCTKNSITIIPQNNIQIVIDYHIDGDTFLTHQIRYKNNAQNKYSITKLEYYISKLIFIKEDLSVIAIKDYQYLSALDPHSNNISICNLPLGNYIGIAFNIGLDSIQNTPDFLEKNIENINMVWPISMGGGYHFLKLEGYFVDSINKQLGYNMHLGKNLCLIPIKLNKKFTISTNDSQIIHLRMNINEWFNNPYNFDLNIDGNHIMGDEKLMKIFKKNGADVFNF